MAAYAEKFEVVESDRGEWKYGRVDGGEVE